MMGQCLFHVDPEAVLYGALQRMGPDFGPGCLTREEVVNGLPVYAHVGVVHERQQPERGRMIRKQSGMNFQFEVFVFRPGATQVPVQIGAVGDLWHQCFRKAKRPVSVVIFRNHPNRVAASVSGVVVGSVVVHSPVQELVVTIAADAVLIEEVGHAELAGA